MPLIVKPKTKKQEKALRTILTEMEIDFITLAEEEQAEYKTSGRKSLTLKEKKILENLEQSVDFVNKYKKGKSKTKSLKQLLDEL